MNSETEKAVMTRPPTAHELGLMEGFPPPADKRPTLYNWDLGPFNRWSFQNVRSIVPTVEVRRGEGPVWPFRTEPGPLDDIRFQSVSGAERTVAELLDYTYSDGFLVYHRGRVLCERYGNGMAPHTLHLSQSVAKSVTGVVAGILVDQGRLDTRAPIVDYVPEMAACGYADALVHHVMDMTSGVRFTEDYGAPDSDMTRVDVAAGWRPTAPGQERPAIRDVILTLPKIREHGQTFEYRSIETDVLAWVMERATSTSLADLVSSELWQPMGAERDACFTVDGAGTALADGGFNATLRDYARIGRLLLEDGVAAGRQVLSTTWIERIRSGDASLFGTPYTELSPNGAYSGKWWIHDVEQGDFMARGVFGQLIYVDPASELMVTKLSSWPDYLVPEFSMDTLHAIAAIRRELHGPAEAPGTR
jgi:CubicO group peptidase (beta-lactamase class C family)